MSTDYLIPSIQQIVSAVGHVAYEMIQRQVEYFINHVRSSGRCTFYSILTSYYL